MAEEGTPRPTPGERTTQRLLRRQSRRAKVGLASILFLASRLGEPGQTDQEGQENNQFTYLSGMPFYAMMRRLAQARWRRQRRLAQLEERAKPRLRVFSRRWTGVPTGSPTSTPAFSASGNLAPIADNSMLFPTAPVASPAQQPQEAQPEMPRRTNIRLDMRRINSLLRKISWSAKARAQLEAELKQVIPGFELALELAPELALELAPVLSSGSKSAAQTVHTASLRHRPLDTVTERASQIRSPEKQQVQQLLEQSNRLIPARSPATIRSRLTASGQPSTESLAQAPVERQKTIERSVVQRTSTRHIQLLDALIQLATQPVEQPPVQATAAKIARAGLLPANRPASSIFREVVSQASTALQPPVRSFRVLQALSVPARSLRSLTALTELTGQQPADKLNIQLDRQLSRSAPLSYRALRRSQTAQLSSSTLLPSPAVSEPLSADSGQTPVVHAAERAQAASTGSILPRPVRIRRDSPAQQTLAAPESALPVSEPVADTQPPQALAGRVADSRKAPVQAVRPAQTAGQPVLTQPAPANAPVQRTARKPAGKLQPIQAAAARDVDSIGMSTVLPSHRQAPKLSAQAIPVEQAASERASYHAVARSTPATSQSARLFLQDPARIDTPRIDIPRLASAVRSKSVSPELTQLEAAPPQVASDTSSHQVFLPQRVASQEQSQAQERAQERAQEQAQERAQERAQEQAQEQAKTVSGQAKQVKKIRQLAALLTRNLTETESARPDTQPAIHRQLARRNAGVRARAVAELKPLVSFNERALSSLSTQQITGIEQRLQNLAARSSSKTFATDPATQKPAAQAQEAQPFHSSPAPLDLLPLVSSAPAVRPARVLRAAVARMERAQTAGMLPSVMTSLEQALAPLARPALRSPGPVFYAASSQESAAQELSGSARLEGTHTTRRAVRSDNAEPTRLRSLQTEPELALPDSSSPAIVRAQQADKAGSSVIPRLSARSLSVEPALLHRVSEQTDSEPQPAQAAQKTAPAPSQAIAPRPSQWAIRRSAAPLAAGVARQSRSVTPASFLQAPEDQQPRAAQPLEGAATLEAEPARPARAGQDQLRAQHTRTQHTRTQHTSTRLNEQASAGTVLPETNLPGVRHPRVNWNLLDQATLPENSSFLPGVRHPRVNWNLLDQATLPENSSLSGTLQQLSAPETQSKAQASNRSSTISQPGWAARAATQEEGQSGLATVDSLTRSLARASSVDEVVNVIMARLEGTNSGSRVLSAAAGELAQTIRSEAIQEVSRETSQELRAAAQRGGDLSREFIQQSGSAQQTAEAPVTRSSRLAAPAAAPLQPRSRGFSHGGRSVSSNAHRVQAGQDTRLMKLVRKLQSLIHLAENSHLADAQRQVRMAEDSAAARAEGQAPIKEATSSEGKRKLDIEAFGREVTEIVTKEIEHRRSRRMEDSDEFWW